MEVHHHETLKMPQLLLSLYKKQHTCIKNEKPPQQQSLVTHQKKMTVTTKMGIATCSNCYYNLIFIYMYHNNCRAISSYHSFSLLKDKLEKRLQLLSIINSKWIIFGHWLTKRKGGHFKPIRIWAACIIWKKLSIRES